MEVDDLTYVPPKSKETLRAEKLRKEQKRQSNKLCQPKRSALPEVSPKRGRLLSASQVRKNALGERDSTGAHILRRYINVTEPATHDPSRDSFKTRSFSTYKGWFS